MTRTCLRAGLRSATAVFVLIAAAHARAQIPDVYVWTGGGATDNWSDPGNWEENRPPMTPADGLIFSPTESGHHTSRQDVADPFQVSVIVIHATRSQFEIGGNPIHMPLGGDIEDTTRVAGGRVVNAPLRISAPVSIIAGDGSWLSPGLTLMDVSGPGSLRVHQGLVRLIRANYTGTTTVSNGHVQVGGAWAPRGSVTPGSTDGQGDYLVRPESTGTRAVLSGTGAIGLAPGKKITVENGGILTPDYFALDGEVSTTLTVNGDVRFGNGGRYRAWANSPGHTDFLDVNGVLDLTGAGDVLDFAGFVVPAGSVVVAEYESRLGEFDVFNYQLFDPGPPFPAPPGRTAILSYTSAPGAGPGQVIVTVVPEPAGAAMIIVMTGGLLIRRRW